MLVNFIKGSVFMTVLRAQETDGLWLKVSQCLAFLLSFVFCLQSNLMDACNFKSEGS